MVRKLFAWFTQRFFSQKREEERAALPFDFLRSRDPSALLRIIEKERPQTIALILSYLERNKASIILQFLPPLIQCDVIRRIATMDRVKPEIIEIVKKALEEEIPPLGMDSFVLRGGVEDAFGLLQTLEPYAEALIIEKMQDEDPELAGALIGRLPKERRRAYDTEEPDSPSKSILPFRKNDTKTPR